MKKAIHSLAIGLLLATASCLSVFARTVPEEGFLVASERIDPLRFLPAPPDSSDLRFAGDLSAYARAGRILQDDPAGIYADEARNGMDTDRLIPYFSVTAGLRVNAQENPETFLLLSRVLEDGRASTLPARERIARPDPLRKGLPCYPSPEITDAYLLAQVLSQLQPTAIVPLMALARDFAEVRVLQLRQWESDIHASVLVAAAVFARLQSSRAYLDQLGKAREELSGRIIPLPPKALTRSDRFLSDTDLPDASRFLPAPPEFMGDTFFPDYAWYFWGKEQRKDPSRAKAALDDYLLGDVDSMNTRFNCCLPVEIAPRKTPLTYRFLVRTANDSKKMNTTAKGYFHRLRPFVLFGEPSLAPGHDDLMGKTFSYPSGHSIRGYACALALAFLFPDRTEALVARSVGIADNRVVCGHHFKSDTEQSLPSAMAAILRLLADPEFLEAVSQARTELGKVK